MSAFEISVLYLLVWRLSVLALGAFLIYLGYLLMKNSNGSMELGSVEAGSEKSKLKLTNLAPGTFFALFGTVILVTAVWGQPAEIVIPQNKVDCNETLDMSSGGITVRGE